MSTTDQVRDLLKTRITEIDSERKRLESALKELTPRKRRGRPPKKK